MNYEKCIPSEEDWGQYWLELDVNLAYQHFAGKTIDDMVSWFSENPLSSSEDLMWMPDVPFRYYLYSFISAVTAYGQYPSQHDNFDNASAAADCFMAMIIWRLKEQPESIIPVFEDVYKVAEYIAAHQDGFDADPDIYGSFVDRLRRIKSLYDNLQR